MKKIILILLLQLILSNITFSQQKKITNNYTQYFKEYSSNFKWNNFSFKTDFKNYYDDLNSLTDDEIILYQNEFNRTISDSVIVFKFNNKPIIQNIEFDDVFLSFGENPDGSFFENLNFIKYFTSDSDDERKKFYLSNLELLTKKFGVTNFFNKNSIWEGSQNLFFALDLSESNVSLRIVHSPKTTNIGSLKQKFDYYFTSDKFKEIDKDNSFRGIKFGTSLETIKTITRLTKSTSNYEYIAKESKYLNWNSITFNIDGTHFGFSKDKKLSVVMLRCDLSDEEEHYKLKEKIISILGSETVNGEYITWSGYNITIYMNKNYLSDDKKDNVILIESNNYKTFFEKDY